jgi:hypothetical protein
MEELIELVAASLARHGIENQASHSQSMERQASSPVTTLVTTVQPAEPILAAMLPDHNYRKVKQESCP